MIFKNKYFLVFYIAFLAFTAKDSNAQNCTKFAFAYYPTVFGKINMNDPTQATIDTIMVKFFRSYEENLEDDEKFSTMFQQQVFNTLPDSISERLSLNALVNARYTLKDIYTIEANGNSRAYNERLRDFTNRYYLEGMSSEGMEIFIYQYVDHRENLFQLDNLASRASPIKLKPIVLDEFEQYLSEADLNVLASGLDRKINDFIRRQSQRDSAYSVSLQIIIPKIDSLKGIYLNSLMSASKSFIETLSQPEQNYWKETSIKYLSRINEVEANELVQMREYDNEYYPNVIWYHEYFYGLKKIFPSSNFWSWRNGPALNIPPSLLESNSDYLKLYTQFENELIDILDKYAANFAYPNYYFSGSRTFSAEKIKRIQIANAILFSAISHN